MKHRLHLVLIAVWGLTLLAGATASTAQEASLTIWTDDQRLPVITELSKIFAEEYGIEVVVEPMGIQDTKDAMIRGASTGEGPDLFIIPHDNIGALVESGVVAPIDLGDKADMFLPNAVEGFVYDGVLYGVPFAIENDACFRNIEMLPELPATWDELADATKALVDRGDAEYAIAFPDLGYNYYPVYSAYGGYLFGRDETGSYLADEVGMDSEGMIAGAQWAYDLIREGYASQTVDWEAAHVMFENGQAPFIITGPWAVSRFKNIGVPYQISACPAAEAGGQPGGPLIGVQGFMVNANSDNVLLAQTYLMEFIATDESMQYIFDNDPRPSAWVSIFEATEDPDMAGFADAGQYGVPMPAIPAMGTVWEAWGNAGLLMAQGELEPADALGDAAEQIRTLIAEAAN